MCEWFNNTSSSSQISVFTWLKRKAFLSLLPICSLSESVLFWVSIFVGLEDRIRDAALSKDVRSKVLGGKYIAEKKNVWYAKLFIEHIFHLQMQGNILVTNTEFQPFAYKSWHYYLLYETLLTRRIIQEFIQHGTTCSLLILTVIHQDLAEERFL